MLQVCNYLKRGGIYIVGDVLVDPDTTLDAPTLDKLSQAQASMAQLVTDTKIKAFSSVLTAPTARQGYHALTSTAGLGALTPNTVVLPWPWTLTACASPEEYVQVMRDIVLLGKNLAILCNATGSFNVAERFEPPRGVNRFMDVFIYPHVELRSWRHFSESSLGLLTVAWSLIGPRVSIRMFKMLSSAGSSSLDEERELIVDIVKRQGRFRIGKRGDGIHVVPHEETTRGTDYWDSMNAVIASRVSAATGMIFLPLVEFRTEAAEQVIANIDKLVCGLGPVLLLEQNQAGSMLMSRAL